VRSYSVTYVNCKVLYIRRENDIIFTRLVPPFVLCRIQYVVSRCELIQMVDISNDTCFSEPSASSLFVAKFRARLCGLVRRSHVEK